jgi:hypothetical protein
VGSGERGGAAASGITFHPGSFDAIIHTDVLC